MKRKNMVVVVASLLVVALVAGELLSQRGPGRGRGRGKGGPGHRGGQQDPTFKADRQGIHFLLANRSKIRRRVKNLKNGIETLTESDSPAIAAKIQQHVAAMYNRLETVRPIRMRDPLFRELFRNARKIDMKVKKTKKGVHVVETSKDPYVARLLQEHAKVVSLFIRNGHAEAHKNHAVPNRKGIARAEKATSPPVQATSCNAKVVCEKGKCKAAVANAKVEVKRCCEDRQKAEKTDEGKCKAKASKSDVSQKGCKSGTCKAAAVKANASAKSCCQEGKSDKGN